VTFGAYGVYVPAQHALDADVTGIGPYVAFSHSIDFVYLGVRFGIAYAWLPSGQAGQQYLIEPEGLLGAELRVGPLRADRRRPVALRLELGGGPLFVGGEGFETATVGHADLRARVQVTVVKSVMVEAFVGPSLVIGSYTVGVYPELGLGGGWSF
jgi:hypothetical protein